MAVEPMTKQVWPGLVRPCLAALLWMSALFSLTPAAAQDDVASGETQIKAAFLYKFTGYVEWPKSTFKDADSPITIGVVGAEEIADELRRIVSGRSVQSRGLTVTVANKESDLSGMHVLFIGRDATAGAARLIDAARQRPILIVTDAADGLDRGGIINFVMVKRRVQFEISVDAAEKAGLALSSRLLSVALRVKKGDIEADLYLARLGGPLAPRALGQRWRRLVYAALSRWVDRNETEFVSFV